LPQQTSWWTCSVSLCTPLHTPIKMYMTPATMQFTMPLNLLKGVKRGWLTIAPPISLIEFCNHVYHIQHEVQLLSNSHPSTWKMGQCKIRHYFKSTTCTYHYTKLIKVIVLLCSAFGKQWILCKLTHQNNICWSKSCASPKYAM
jgi:hypothetical protein